MNNHERIKLAFTDIKAPEGFADKILNPTKNNTSVSRAQTQRYTPRRFGRKIGATLAAAVLIAFALAITALAATDIIDVRSFFAGPFFRSVFDNEAAAPYVQAGDDITMNADGSFYITYVGADGNIVEEIENEIDVEILAAFVDGGIFFDMLITDSTDGRLTGPVNFISWNEDWGDYHNIGGGQAEIIDEHTMRVDFHLPGWVEERYRVHFSMIAMGVEFIEMFPTEFIVGEHLGLESPLALPGNVVEITAANLNTAGDMLIVEIQPSDLAVRGTGEYSLGVMTPNGEIIWARRSEINLAINIGDADPNELVFVWSGLRAERIIHGNWDFTVTIDDDARLEHAGFYGEFEGYRTEITVSATTVRIYVYGLITRDITEEIWENEGSLVIYLADGTTVMPRVGGTETSTDVSLLVYSFDEFIHPNDVERIIFRGIEISG